MLRSLCSILAVQPGGMPPWRSKGGGTRTNTRAINTANYGTASDKRQDTDSAADEGCSVKYTMLVVMIIYVDIYTYIRPLRNIVKDLFS